MPDPLINPMKIQEITMRQAVGQGAMPGLELGSLGRPESLRQTQVEQGRLMGTSVSQDGMTGVMPESFTRSLLGEIVMDPEGPAPGMAGDSRKLHPGWPQLENGVSFALSLESIGIAIYNMLKAMEEARKNWRDTLTPTMRSTQDSWKGTGCFPIDIIVNDKGIVTGGQPFPAIVGGGFHVGPTPGKTTDPGFLGFRYQAIYVFAGDMMRCDMGEYLEFSTVQIAGNGVNTRSEGKEKHEKQKQHPSTLQYVGGMIGYVDRAGTDMKAELRNRGLSGDPSDYDWSYEARILLFLTGDGPAVYKYLDIEVSLAQGAKEATGKMTLSDK